MKITCEMNCPCPAMETVDGIDYCQKEEGECEYQKLKDDPDIENFTINYNDGSSKTVGKGFFCEMVQKSDTYELKFDLVDVSGHDLEAIVYGCIQLGEKLGMFDKMKNSCKDEACTYHKEDEDCPAREGCAGYEGPDTI